MEKKQAKRKVTVNQKAVSLLGKKWVIKNSSVDQDVLQTLLLNRGITSPREQQEFLGTLEINLHDPFLFKDMRKAVDRIVEAINKQQKIIIFGDYDVDGISGTALLVHALNKIGAIVSYRLPHRVEDGYGLSDKFIADFKEAEANLIITVDCGISNYEQIQKINEAGIDVIITDHHSMPANIPAAYAIIHPKVPGETYPFDGLTGSGVAFKLAQALLQEHKHPQAEVDKLIDLASLGTVADMGPLKGENRLIVKKGLEALQNTKWKGLEMIKEKAGIDPQSILDSNNIGFQISPRINAAGRIDTPYLALQLLLHEEEKPSTQGMAQRLEELNTKRQSMTKQAVDELIEFVSTLGGKPKVIVKSNADWHIGIVGLIAGRAVERYGVPAIIMQDFGDSLVGSCRSPQGVNVTEALRAHKELLNSFGGHENAAGFSMKKENLDVFTKSVEKYFEDLLKDQSMLPELHIDCVLPEESLNVDLVKSLQDFEPFGIENKQPLFLIENCQIRYMKRVGTDGNHLKLTLQKGTKKIDAIGFALGEHISTIRNHQSVKVAANIDINKWDGKEIFQLRIQDIAPSD